MRIVFCGSGQVAAVSLEALQAAGHDIAMVITQPARKAGRGGKLTPTPVADCAAALGREATPCANINEVERVQTLAATEPELIVVVDFGQRVGSAVRELAPHGAINMHASLLPALRGAAPINWAIVRGLTHTGVTTYTLVDRMDAGPILLQDSLQIDPTENAEQLRVRLSHLGAEMVLRTLQGLDDGTLTGQPQDETLATSAPKLTKHDGAIDFNDSAVAIVNRIRGLRPWPLAHADFVRAGRKRVRVIFTEAGAMLTGEPNPAAAGTVADDLTINVPDGAVEIVQLKVAGKRVMDWGDFINGYRVAAGDRFVSSGGGDRG